MPTSPVFGDDVDHGPVAAPENAGNVEFLADLFEVSGGEPRSEDCGDRLA
jgi:hypothetical protein